MRAVFSERTMAGGDKEKAMKATYEVIVGE